MRRAVTKSSRTSKVVELEFILFASPLKAHTEKATMCIQMDL